MEGSPLGPTTSIETKPPGASAVTVLISSGPSSTRKVLGPVSVTGTPSARVGIVESDPVTASRSTDELTTTSIAARSGTTDRRRDRITRRRRSRGRARDEVVAIGIEDLDLEVTVGRVGSGGEHQRLVVAIDDEHRRGGGCRGPVRIDRGGARRRDRRDVDAARPTGVIGHAEHVRPLGREQPRLDPIAALVVQATCRAARVHDLQQWIGVVVRIGEQDHGLGTRLDLEHVT